MLQADLDHDREVELLASLWTYQPELPRAILAQVSMGEEEEEQQEAAGGGEGGRQRARGMYACMHEREHELLGSLPYSY